MREAILLPSARSVFRRLSAQEQAQVNHRISLIEHDPFPDDVLKVELETPSEAYIMFHDGVWAISYSLPDGATVAIRSIRKIDPSLRLRL